LTSPGPPRGLFFLCGGLTTPALPLLFSRFPDPDDWWAQFLVGPFIPVFFLFPFAGLRTSCSFPRPMSSAALSNWSAPPPFACITLLRFFHRFPYESRVSGKLLLGCFRRVLSLGGTFFRSKSTPTPPLVSDDFLFVILMPDLSFRRHALKFSPSPYCFPFFCVASWPLPPCPFPTLLFL